MGSQNDVADDSLDSIFFLSSNGADWITGTGLSVPPSPSPSPGLDKPILNSSFEITGLETSLWCGNAEKLDRSLLEQKQSLSFDKRSKNMCCHSAGLNSPIWTVPVEISPLVQMDLNDNSSLIRHELNDPSQLQAWQPSNFDLETFIDPYAALVVPASKLEKCSSTGTVEEPRKTYAQVCTVDTSDPSPVLFYLDMLQKTRMLATKGDPFSEPNAGLEPMKKQWNTAVCTLKEMRASVQLLGEAPNWKEFLVEDEVINGVIEEAQKLPAMGFETQLKPVTCQSERSRFLKLYTSHPDKLLALPEGMKVSQEPELCLGKSYFGGKVSFGLAEVSGEERVVAIRQVPGGDVADFCIRRLQDFTRHVINCNTHLLPYRRTVTFDNSWFLARDLCDWNLDQFLAEKRTCGQPIDLVLETAPLFYHMCKGLAFLHSKIPTLFHGNMKPTNLLIDSHGILRLVDFGFGKLCTLRHQQFGACLQADGTLHPICWKPPEFYQVCTTYGGRSDVHSAAMLAYYMMTCGRHPFLGTDAAAHTSVELEELVCAGATHIEGVPCEATHLLERMLSVDLEKRPEAEAVLLDPFFWTDHRKIGFLLAVAAKMQTVANEDEVRSQLYAEEVESAFCGQNSRSASMYDNGDGGRRTMANLLLLIVAEFTRGLDTDPDPSDFLHKYTNFFLRVFLKIEGSSVWKSSSLLQPFFVSK